MLKQFHQPHGEELAHDPKLIACEIQNRRAFQMIVPFQLPKPLAIVR